MPNLQYSESDLQQNRASLILSGGTASDRRKWVEQAHRVMGALGPLVEVKNGLELAPALTGSSGVVFVPDLASLSTAEQGQITRCLMAQEERPKLILGLSISPDDARSRGTVRDDLVYWLQRALVQLGPARAGEGAKPGKKARSAGQ